MWQDLLGLVDLKKFSCITNNEVVQLHRLFSGIGFVNEALILDCESQNATILTESQVDHAKIKHIYLLCHFLRYMFKDTKILLVKA